MSVRAPPLWQWRLTGLRERLGRLTAHSLVRGISAMLGLLPLRVAPAVGSLLSRVLKLSGYRSATLRSGLRSLPLHDDCERLDAERAAYDHVGMSLALTLQPARRDAQIASLLLPPPPQLAELLADIDRGHGVLFLSAHLGAWELLPQCIMPLLRTHTPVSIVYRPLHNAFLNAWLLSRRSRHGGTFTPDRGSLPQLAAALRAGGVVCMLADQRPSARQRASRHLFLGRRSSFACGADILHRETGSPVWFGALVLADDPQPARQGEKGAGLAGKATLPRLRLVLQRLELLDAGCSDNTFSSEPSGRSSWCTSGRRCSPPSALPVLHPQLSPSTRLTPPPVESSGKGLSPHRVGCEVGPSTGAGAAGGDCAAGGGDMVMRAYAEALSRAVEAYPAQYFWWHRRWEKGGDAAQGGSGADRACATALG